MIDLRRVSFKDAPLNGLRCKLYAKDNCETKTGASCAEDCEVLSPANLSAQAAQMLKLILLTEPFSESQLPVLYNTETVTTLRQVSDCEKIFKT